MLCGTATRYQLRQSEDPITTANFDDAEPLGSAPDPVDAGNTQSVTLPPERKRFVAIRAVDDQGNVGAVAVVGP